MPDVLRLFREKAPKVRLSLKSVNCYVIRDSLLADHTDLGVFYRVGNDDALHMEYFGQQELVLVASPQLQHVDFTQREQHIPVSFIINEPQCVFRQIFESALRERKITFESTIELWSIESIKQCVASNLGISFCHVSVCCGNWLRASCRSCHFPRLRHRLLRFVHIMQAER